MTTTTDGVLRVYAATRGIRRFSVAFLVVLLGYLVLVLLPGGSWLDRTVAILLVLGHLPVTLQNCSRLDARPDTLVIDHRVRRHDMRWEDIATLRIHWAWGGGLRPKLPEVELEDGRVVRAGVLAQVAKPRRREERDRLVERLRVEAEGRDFVLEVQEPARRSTRG